MKLTLTSLLSLWLLAGGFAFGQGAGVSGGLTLIEAPGARPAALGQAYTAMQNDIGAMAYNPASLSSLSSGQMSFLYHRGIVDDAFGQFLVGAPTTNGAIGISVGYYNGGSIDLVTGGSQHSVNAQTDLDAGFGYGRKWGPLSAGFTAKYISSELAQTSKAHAFALDAGVDFPLNPRVSWGAAVQNLGTALKFMDVGDPLPRIVRTGLAATLGQAYRPVTLLVDLPYLLNEQKLRPGLGAELGLSPIFLRAGYQSGSALEGLTLGMGFSLNRLTVDYSFGFVQRLNTNQRISISLRFGAERQEAQ